MAEEALGHLSDINVTCQTSTLGQLSDVNVEALGHLADIMFALRSNPNHGGPNCSPSGLNLGLTRSNPVALHPTLCDMHESLAPYTLRRPIP